ncbi:hypothetical protein [Enterococcus faecalis]|uniref:hypothetical protein n=1 Tax=Enterococcus faecalis TaxID=1351 RepID=UPI001928F6CA|nr:hypothetical protein [Enterococcus faecalis]EGO2575400.1 hypothetical protein [Enterococcus faecalis]MDN3168156.1 hypothetical protein [Enterococcus faecalis]WHK69933.1 hypothetical protein QLQ58_00165 [Enterococcus faecalis]
MNTKKSNWSIIAFFIPYIVSNIFVFFTLIEKDNKLLEVIEESSKLLNISNGKFNFFMIVVVIIANLFIFFVTFILLKIILLIFGLKKNYDQDIFICLLLSVSLVNLLVIVISQIVTIDRLPLSISTSIIEVIVFLLLFYSNNKDVRATKLLFFGKLLLLLINIGSLII